MKRPRRIRKRKGSDHLSISARNAEWEEVRGKADRAGLPIARYVKGLVERDLGGDKGLMALAADEQRELLDGVREIRALLREDAAPPADDRDPAARRRVGRSRRSPAGRQRRSRIGRSRARAACSGSEAAWSRRSSS